jgi:anti-anti-sigma factor
MNSMKSRISRQGELTVVELSGYLSFESAGPIRESIEQIFKQNSDAQVLINLEQLEFIGSSGVSTFVKSLKNFNGLKMKPMYYGVKSEFMRLFRAFEEDKPFEVLTSKAEAETAAVNRYQAWEMSAERSKKTH